MGAGSGGEGGGGRELGAEGGRAKEETREYDGDSKQKRQTECLSLLRSSGQEE